MILLVEFLTLNHLSLVQNPEEALLAGATKVQKLATYVPNNKISKAVNLINTLKKVVKRSKKKTRWTN